tara:strand:+ start:643 stop:882 length:240 start_codon:yes stop_codon:yes gene_type:complete
MVQRFEIAKKIDCSKILPAECSDNIIEKLSSLGLKLKKNTETDIVHGHIDIEHMPNNHFITVHVYEKTNLKHKDFEELI